MATPDEAARLDELSQAERLEEMGVLVHVVDSDASSDSSVGWDSDEERDRELEEAAHTPPRTPPRRRAVTPPRPRVATPPPPRRRVSRRLTRSASRAREAHARVRGGEPATPPTPEGVIVVPDESPEPVRTLTQEEADRALALRLQREEEERVERERMAARRRREQQQRAAEAAAAQQQQHQQQRQQQHGGPPETDPLGLRYMALMQLRQYLAEARAEGRARGRGRDRRGRGRARGRGRGRGRGVARVQMMPRAPQLFAAPFLGRVLAAHSNFDLMTRELTADDYERLLALDEQTGSNKAKGLDAAVLDTLPVERVGGAPGETPCPICLEDFKPGEECRRLPCTHMFHKGCCDRWLQQNATCPVCKTAIG